MKTEIKALLDRLIYCGYNIPPENAKKIIESTALEADKFACAIMEADGADPNDLINMRRRIRNEFIRHFGCHEINRNEFQDGLL